MAKVRYIQGKKASYLSLSKYDPMALYFCTDTQELYKGDQLYSDGVRFVMSYDSLPAYSVAASGILYFCVDTGCGYVLNETHNGWVAVIFGVDNQTIGVNELGLMTVKSVPIAKVAGLTEELQRISAIALEGTKTATSTTAGLVKPGNGLTVAADGTLSLSQIAITDVTGLSERLTAVEEAVVGVDLSGYADRNELRATAKMQRYAISHEPYGTLVNYTDEEIRVMCPANTPWSLQQSGENADANSYYIGLQAYAPLDAAVSFKEDLAETISDDTMYFFEDNEFAGVDEFGRKYSIVWLPVAAYDASSDTWVYHGEKSSDGKYIGWYYTVEWFDAAGVRIATDTIRINLSNESCHNHVVPYYVADVKSAIASLEENMTWENI